MQHTNINDFQAAKIFSKETFILNQIKNKEILDIGCVDDSLNIFKNHNKQWLHNKIINQAKYVLGIDILDREIEELRTYGFNVQVGDATKFISNKKFDTIVCGDIIEHLTNPGELFSRCAENLKENGEIIICTPNPQAATRFMNIFFDKSTPIHTAHTMWFDPQTLVQLAERYGFELKYFSWLTTDYPCKTQRRFWKYFANFLTEKLVKHNHRFATDFGMTFCKKNPNISPRFSVIIPTYNRSDMVINTIKDFLQQDYINEFEILIIDNNSQKQHTNTILDFLKKLKTNIPIRLISEPRQGLVYSRHTGAAFASYEYLFFCDDDGRYDKNCLSSIAEVYRDSSGVQAVGTKIIIEWDKQPSLIAQKNESLLGKLDYGKTFSSQCFYINGGSFSIKKDLLYFIKGFNPGQINDYLIGNCETGLCQKLFSIFAGIGFTDKTVMRHQQYIHKMDQFLI